MQIHKIPYTISGGSSFFSKAEIKDIISYLRLIVNPDDRAFLRVINTHKREVGSATIHKLGEYASQHHCSFFHTLHNLENFELHNFTKRNLVSFKNLILNTQQQINSSISVQELKNIINIFIDNISRIDNG